MRNLFDFLLKYSNTLLFAFLFILSVVLLFSSNLFHTSIWFSSANVVSSRVFGIANGVSGYFNLRSINLSLQQSNARLENEVLNLRNELASCKAVLNDSIDNSRSKRFDYVLATVISNSTRHPHNYFSIDKGEADGVTKGLGVVDQNGVVGIVNVTGAHTARVMSLLNPTLKLSARLKDTNVVGSLSWEGTDPNIGYLGELPRYSTFAIGDTVVTSGYSTAFPAGIPIGYVVGRIKSENDNFYVLKIKLASDFNSLSMVRVLKDSYKSELDSLAGYDIEVKDGNL